MEDNVGNPMLMAFVLKENQGSNPCEGSLVALHFFRQPILNVFVGERIRHVWIVVAFIEQEGQKVGRKKYQVGGPDLESPLHGTCEVVQNVIKKPLFRCQRKAISNSDNIGAKLDKNVGALSVFRNLQPLKIPFPIRRRYIKLKHWQDASRVL